MGNNLDFGCDGRIATSVSGLVVFLRSYLRCQYIQLLDNWCVIMVVGFSAPSVTPDLVGLFLFV